MRGIPRGMDVLSNVGFLAGGLLGRWATRVHRLGYLNDAMRHSLVLAMLCAPTHAPEPAWGLLVVAYAVAKACEHWDARVYELTCALVSGHTLKHVIAAAPAFVATWGLRRRALRS